MARSFDKGSLQHLSVYPNSVPSGPPMTFAAWIRTPDVLAVGVTFRMVISLSDWDLNPGEGYVLVYADAGGGNFYGGMTFGTDGIARYDVISGDPTLNTWQHWAAHYEADGTVLFFLNGTVGPYTQGGAGTLPSLTEDILCIGSGAGVSAFNSHWNGDICEVGVWDVLLSGSEIDSLSYGYSPAFIRPQDLVCYYPLHEDFVTDYGYQGEVLTNDGTTFVGHPPQVYPAPPLMGPGAYTAPIGANVPEKWHHYSKNLA